jgi:hypothetical protein
MERDEAVKLIDDHKNKLIHPVEMLHWTRLRVIINNIEPAAWDAAVTKMVEITSG